MRVRPVTGTDEDRTLIHLPLEVEPVREARFPLPSTQQLGGHDSALLLRDALLLSLRRGAGPFRSFGQISVEPRAYQLVPLLMALKLDPVRLLIADDVGVGKTIEALLIARELLDRGDIDRTVVLCPPHLVDQWVTELEVRFHIRAAAVTARSTRRLERGIPPGVSIFSEYRHTVVSLDYVKTRERRDHFLQACPDFVIVDEAHTCASAGQRRHQRRELLQGLAGTASRHLVLLTATPHSGDDAAFYRLLGLLSPDFERLAEVTGTARERLRDRLARHFVQRRRPDIAEWHEGDIFPRRETRELTYQLTGAWEAFFNNVLDYCAEVVATGAGDEMRQRLNFWGTLALLRCTGSSPVAAVLALRTRAGEDLGDETREDLLDRIFDGDVDALVADDVEPPVGGDSPALARLITAGGEPRGSERRSQAQDRLGTRCGIGRGGVQRSGILSLHRDRSLRGPPLPGEPEGNCRRRRDRRDAPGRTPGDSSAGRRDRRRQDPGHHRLPVGGRQTCRTTSTPSFTTTCRGTPRDMSSARPCGPLRPAEHDGTRHAPVRRQQPD